MVTSPSSSGPGQYPPPGTDDGSNPSGDATLEEEALIAIKMYKAGFARYMEIPCICGVGEAPANRCPSCSGLANFREVILSALRKIIVKYNGEQRERESNYSDTGPRRVGAVPRQE